MIGGNGIENKVVRSGQCFHGIGVTADDKMVRPKPSSVFFLRRRRAKNGNFGPHRDREFYAHVAEAAQADDTDFMSFCDAKFSER